MQNQSNCRITFDAQLKSALYREKQKQQFRDKEQNYKEGSAWITVHQI